MDALVYRYLNQDIPDVRENCLKVASETSNTIQKMVDKRADRRYANYSVLASVLRGSLANREGMVLDSA